MHTVSQFPPGYRFSPTDEELILYYLKNKASYKSIPAQVIQDMDASEFYSRPPWDLVENPYGEREWYFFIYQDEHFHGDRETIRIVEKGVGFWKLMGGEDSVYDSNGDVFAFKTFFTYFSRSITNEKKTHWRMELYRLPIACSNQEQKKNEWVLVRITRGIDYTSYF